MKLRSDLHISRKIYHMLGVFLIIALFHCFRDQKALNYSLDRMSITLAVLIVLPFDFARLKFQRVNQTTLSFFRRFMRSDELDHLSAMSYLLMGCWIVIHFFHPAVVTLSLLMLAIGDPISSIIGVIYGKDKIIGNKSLQGTLAGFVSCTLVAGVYYLTQNLMVERLVLVSLLSGIVGAFAEAVPVGRVDDNFTFPVISAVMLTGLFYIFGGFS